MKKAVILLAMLAAALAANAADIHYAYTSLSLEQGLSSPTVKAIYKDKAGSMWVGTKEGLDRFSAAGHKSYPLKGESILSIAEDPDGLLWVGTLNSLFTYDRQNDDFVENRCGAMGRCVVWNDEMWVYNYNSIFRFRAGERENPKRTDFPVNIDIYSIAILPDGTPVLGTRTNGLWTYDPGTDGIKRFSQTCIAGLHCLYLDADTLYAGSKGEGVHLFGTDGTYKGKVKGLPSEYVVDIARCDGNIWIATDGGGIAILGGDGDISLLRHTPGDLSSLPSDAIYAVYADRDGDIWLGTVRYGLINVHRLYVKTYREVALGSTNGLSERCAFGIYRDDEGIIWIGTDGQGINRFDPETGGFTHYPGTFGDYIPTITGYNEDELLLMRFHKGMYLFNKNTGTYRPFKVNGKIADSGEWNGDFIPYCFKVTDRMICTFGYRPYAHDPLTGKTEMMEFESGESPEWASMKWYCSDFMLVSKGNEIFINRFNDTVLHSLCNTGNSGNILCTAYDGIGRRIWIGTDSGIGSIDFDPATGECASFRSLPWVPFEKASTLTVDDKGRLWIAADTRMYLYCPENGQFRTYGVYDGFERNDILMGYSPLACGEMFWWTGSSGLVAVNTALADACIETETPEISLSEAITDKKRYVADDIQKKLRLPWNHGTITLNYEVSGLKFYEDAIYTYTISGKDESVVTSRSASLAIATLSPGEYSISASCKPAAGSSVDKACTVLISVRPPWNRTKAFNILMLMALAAVMIVGTYLIISRNMVRSGIVESAISDKDKDFLDKFNRLIDSCMEKEDLSSEFLTRELGISRTGLFEKIKMLTGYSLNEYIKRIRINRAVELLKDTEMSIGAISDATGFSSPRFFSSVFKELTGSSPSQFRKSGQ